MWNSCHAAAQLCMHARSLLKLLACAKQDKQGKASIIMISSDHLQGSPSHTGSLPLSTCKPCGCQPVRSVCPSVGSKSARHGSKSCAWQLSRVTICELTTPSRLPSQWCTGPKAEQVSAALYTVMNEYGEVMGSHFSFSTAPKEHQQAIMAMRQRYSEGRGPKHVWVDDSDLASLFTATWPDLQSFEDIMHVMARLTKPIPPDWPLLCKCLSALPCPCP